MHWGLSSLRSTEEKYINEMRGKWCFVDALGSVLAAFNRREIHK